MKVCECKRLWVQEIVRVFLYYARAVDPSMLTITNKIGFMQAEPTEKIADMVQIPLHFIMRV
ncbi:hypothetical protein EON64_17580 [archaeon]|nr:MAG: hypothetical protein EON64_17580 [archaeon]